MAASFDYIETSAIAMTPARSSFTFRLGGMSDRAIAWLFITPTVALLLAINIFPLFWAIACFALALLGSGAHALMPGRSRAVS